MAGVQWATKTLLMKPVLRLIRDLAIKVIYIWKGHTDSERGGEGLFREGIKLLLIYNLPI